MASTSTVLSVRPGVTKYMPESVSSVIKGKRGTEGIQERRKEADREIIKSSK